jgi:hypothetical protein
MRNELLPDSEVDDAFHWLHDNVDAIAEARAHRLHLEDYSDVLIARIRKEHPSLSVAAQLREAHASVRYEEFLEGLKLARRNDEKLRGLRDIKLAIVDAWRTAASNRRASI